MLALNTADRPSPPLQRTPIADRPLRAQLVAAPELDRVAAIIGSAHTTATVAAFAAAGFTAVSINASPVRISAQERDLTRTGQVVHVVADVADPEEISAALAHAATLGSLTHVVVLPSGHRAGSYAEPPFAVAVQTDLLQAHMTATRAAVALAQTGRGTSLTLTTSPRSPAGAGLEVAARDLAGAYSGTGMRVNVLQAGPHTDDLALADAYVAVAVHLRSMTGQTLGVGTARLAS